MLAVVVASPIATIAAAEYAMSWWAVFLVTSGGMALFWDLALHREDEARRPLMSKEDPVLGPMHCYEAGFWEALEPLQLGGAWVPVMVEAGSEGPSAEQQETYRDILRDPAGIRAELTSTLASVPGQATHPGVVPLRVFLPLHGPEEPASMEIDVRVDGDETGPMEQVVRFLDGKAIVEPKPDGVSGNRVA